MTQDSRPRDGFFTFFPASAVGTETSDSTSRVVLRSGHPVLSAMKSIKISRRDEDLPVRFQTGLRRRAQALTRSASLRV